MSKNIISYTLLGAILGYIVAHPLIMILGHLMLESFDPGHSIQEDIITLFYLSFSVDMLPWGIAASIFSALIALLHGTNKQYRKQLEYSNRTKDLVTDIMRHDLLNPVGIIMNAAEFLEENEGLKNSPEIPLIKRNSKKLEELIQDASTFAKISSVDSIEKKELDISTLIRNIIDDFDSYIKEKKMKVIFETEGVHKINASATIESVFINLLSNAIKYSPEGTEIKIVLKMDGADKIISFIDQGDGISDEHKEAVFERFTRKDKGGAKGTGLGLAIVKRIVEMHGGSVWVEDNPEGGSVFKVKLTEAI